VTLSWLRGKVAGGNVRWGIGGFSVGNARRTNCPRDIWGKLSWKYFGNIMGKMFRIGNGQGMCGGLSEKKCPV